MKSAGWFRNRATELYHAGGELEIDSDAPVSIGVSDGAYVQAWVWVPIDTTPKTAGEQKRAKK